MVDIICNGGTLSLNVNIDDIPLFIDTMVLFNLFTVTTDKIQFIMNISFVVMMQNVLLKMTVSLHLYSQIQLLSSIIWIIIYFNRIQWQSFFFRFCFDTWVYYSRSDNLNYTLKPCMYRRKQFYRL